MKLYLKNLLMAALMAVSLPTLAQGVQRDALRLAIEHFNPDHTRDLRSDGPEYRFMTAVLEAVGKADARLAPVGGGPSGGHLFSDPFLSLSTSVFVATPARDAGRGGPKGAKPESHHERAAALVSSLESLVEGCPYRRTTVTELSNGGEQVTNVVTEYRLQADGKQQCVRRDVTDALVRLGLERIRVQEDRSRVGALLAVHAYGDAGVWRDMDYVKAQALKIDGARALVGALDSTMNEQMRVGVSRSVSLMGSRGGADVTDTIKLRYFRGRGDCPAGCIERNYWIATVTPKLQSDGQYTFDVSVVEDEGAGKSPRRPMPRVGL